MKIVGFFLFFCMVISPGLSAADEFTEAQLNSGIKNSEVASYMLIQQARQDRSQADALLGRAVEYSPDLPAVYFELAKSKFSFSYMGLLNSIDYIVVGISAYAKNFWWSFSLAAAAFLSVILSFISVIICIVILRMVSDLQLLSHEIQESKQNIIMLAALIVLSLISPLLLLGGLMVVFGLYMSGKDKIVVYLFLAFLIVSPFLFRASSQFVRVASSGAMKAVVDLNESKDNSYAISALKSSNRPWEVFAYALALKRAGLYGESVSAYLKFLDSNKEAAAYVNLGNAYVGLNNQADAMKSYLASVAIRPMASAYYNLSQLSRENLDFGKGDEYFSKAMALDRDAVLGFRSVYGRNPNRLVADEQLSSSALWNIAWKMNVKPSTFNLSLLPDWGISIFSFLLMVVFFMLGRHAGNKAYRCKRCDMIFCPQCEKRLLWGQMCPQCYRSLVKLEEIEMKNRVAQLMSIYEHQQRRRTVMKILSFFVPGSSQIYAGRILYGFIFMWPFLFLLIFPLMTSFMSPDVYGTHGMLNIVSLLAAAILLILSNIFIRQRISKGWL